MDSKMMMSSQIPAMPGILILKKWVAGCVPWERKEGTEIFYSLQFKQWDQVSVVKPEQVGREILVKKKGIIVYWAVLAGGSAGLIGRLSMILDFRNAKVQHWAWPQDDQQENCNCCNFSYQDQTGLA